MEKNFCYSCMKELAENQTVCEECGYAVNNSPKEPYHLIPGTIIQGRYLVGKVLGYGGFGVTYVGLDLVLEKKIAIKEYLPTDFSTRMPGQTLLTVYSGESSEQFTAGLESFIQEARRLAKFNDLPGVVEIMDSFTSNNTAYIVMEFLDGETAKTRLDNKGVFSFDDAAALIVAVLDTLQEVHKSGIIHRDISPDNIFITKDGEIKLLDFGAARYATTTHSKSLSVILKPGYAPEEQYRTHGNQGPWSDVYAAAATLYKLITGITPEESLERLAKDELKEPSKLGVKIDKDAENALMNALNIKVEDRTSSAADFKQALISNTPVLRNLIKQKKQDVGKWPIWLRLGVVAVIGIAITVAVLIATGVLNPDMANWTTNLPEGMINAPGILNKTIEIAEKQVTEKKLILKIVDKQNSEKAKSNTVMLQDPLPGRLVAYGDVLNVVISAGQEQIFVPNVINFAKDDAVKLLQKTGFKVKIEEKEDKEYAVGTVLMQSLEENTAVNRNTIITIITAIGGSEITDKDVTVPELVGMSYEQAVKALRKVGLYALKKEEVYVKNKPKGIVMIQSVKAGESVKSGSSVSLSVSKGEEKIRVPDVQYKNENEAVSLLELNGLRAKLSYKNDKTVAKGVVISQGVAANTEVQPGSVVELVVSLGDDVEVPSAIGQNKASAESAVAAAGLQIYVVEQFSEEVVKGAVISQTPQGGAKIARGSTVTITISKGKDPKAKKVSVPLVVGKNRNEALATLRNVELSSAFDEAYSDTVPVGIVISQNPAEGQETVRGASVALTISKGPDKVNVPSVVGLAQADGSTMVANAGLSATVDTQYSDTVAKGLIISQQPAGGSRVKLGTSVQLTISRGSNKANVPTVSGASENDARGALQAAGFGVTVSYEHSDGTPRGTVILQSATGSQLLGSNVNIVVSRGTADSGWIDGDGSTVDASNYNVTTRLLYQSREKQYQDSNQNTLAGWEMTGTPAESWGEWSAWQDAEIGSSAIRDVGTQIVQVQTGSKTQWHYERWRCNPQTTAPSSHGWYTYEASGWRDSQIPQEGTSLEGGVPKYREPNTNNGYWYHEQTQTVPIYGVKTQWRCRDKVYTYHYWQWGGWSDFGEALVTADGNREVQTKTQYKYSGK
ncbi:MAG: PASTA domain-containing protein [Christensenella sp.]